MIFFFIDVISKPQFHLCNFLIIYLKIIDIDDENHEINFAGLDKELDNIFIAD